MTMKQQQRVIGREGVRGTVALVEGGEGGTGRTIIDLEDGRRIAVQSDLLEPQADGTLLLPLGPSDIAAVDRSEEAGSASQQIDSVRAGESPEVIPLAQEQVRVEKRTTATGVRVHITTQQHDEVIDLPLVHEQVTVERVPVNEYVDVAPPTRTEGDTIIIPLLEEVVHVEKRLMVREEVHIHRQREEIHEEQRVTLRREQAQMERLDNPGQSGRQERRAG